MHLGENNSADIQRIPKPSVQRYFDEAHRCYFFGLNRACITLCRAILEAALKELLGPNHRPHELLDLAGEPYLNGEPLLDEERHQAARRIFRISALWTMKSTEHIRRESPSPRLRLGLRMSPRW